jgi:PP-loop superfamily ATP-utilizing enzyme
MADDYNDRLWISLSGGMDSEFVLKVGLENKVPITPVIVQTSGNSEEILWALKFCKERNVVPTILKISDRELISLWYKQIYDPILGRGFNWGPTLKVIQHAKQHGVM